MDAFDQLMCCVGLNDSLDDFVLPGLNRVTNATSLCEPVQGIQSGGSIHTIILLRSGLLTVNAIWSY